MLGIISFLVASLYILYYCNVSYLECIKKVYVLLLAIPLSYLDGFNTIDALKIGIVSVPQLIIIEVFAIGLICKTGEQRIVIQKKNDLLVLLLFSLYIIDLAFNIDRPLAIKDASTYIIPMLLLLSVRIFSSRIDCMEFVDLSVRGLFYNSIILTIAYLTIWKVAGENGRFGVTVESLYVFSIPVMFAKVLDKNEKYNMRVRYAIGVVLQFFLLLVSQTRTLIIVVSFLMFLAIIRLVKYKKTLRKGVALLSLAVCIFTAGIVYVIQIGGNGAGWASRMYELIQTGILTQSNSIRTRLIHFYIPQIVSHPLGHGFGYPMYNWVLSNNQKMILSEEITLGVDNFILTYCYKFGFFFFIVFIILLGKAYRQFYRYLKNHDQDENSMIGYYAMLTLLLPTALMSGQILDNFTISCFFQLFIAVNTQQKRREK